MAQGQLNAGHLGGRFLKRAFPQKVKPVPSRVSDDTVADQPRQALSEVNRRSRTSAAMIGLAISMGVPSLLLANSDEAMASDPVGSEPVLAATPSAFDVAASSSEAEASSSNQVLSPSVNGTIEHTVQEGQTIWQLAQMYGVDAVTVATVNRVPLDAVLRVGQVLHIPVEQSTEVATVNIDESTPSYYGMVSAVPTPSESATTGDRPNYSADQPLKVEQEASVERLRQKQANLRASLNKLKTINPELPAVPVLPGAETETTGAGKQATSSYTVSPGDTLSAIARSHGISPRELAAANGLTNPDIIFVNQVLTIPQSKASSQSTTLAGSQAAVPNLVAMSTTPSAPAIPVITADTKAEDLTVPTQLVQTPKDDFSTQVAFVPSRSGTSRQEQSAQPANTTGVTVATSPYSLNSATDSSISGSQQNYVESLKQEIFKLREKYKSAGSGFQATSQSGTKVAAISLNSGASSEATIAPTRINPEFNPRGNSEALRNQVRKLQTKVQLRSTDVGRESATTSSSSAQPQLVATASVGAETYEPLLPSSLGRTVAPNLPPLGAVENYLPGTSGKFNGYIWPTKGVLTSGYGWRWGRMHKGIDIAAPIGTPIVAAAPGVVITAGWNSGGYGNLVEVQHPDGSITLYAHNERILVREGQQVQQGQQIAEMGSTGYSTGPHCHFEVHLPGHGAVNPMAHLSRGAS